MAKDKNLARALHAFYNSLDEKQKEKAKTCSNMEEVAQFAEAEGLELPDEVLEAVSGGYIFLTDLSAPGGLWDIIDDTDGSVIKGGVVSQGRAREMARELGQSDDRIDWNSLDKLRRQANNGW